MTSTSPTARSRPTVLHVVESLGGGVLSAVRDYIASTPQYDHVVLFRDRDGHGTGERFDGLAEERAVVSRRLDQAVAEVSRVYRELQPDLVHAHSSFGGVWARLASVPTDRIVYTPHCYAFERQDIPALGRRAFRIAERILGRRTAAVAAVSPREAQLARRLNPSVRANHVPNVARVPTLARVGAGASAPERTLDASPPNGTLTAVAVGRLCDQKDPAYFAEVVRNARLDGSEVRWQWLGGGTPEQEQALRDEGIEVSGWIPRREVLTRLADADVYVHTAAWEGAPITVLEAAVLGVPIVGRRIQPLESLGIDRLGDSPAVVAGHVLAMADDDVHRHGVAESAALSTRHHPDRQAEALDRVYRRVLDRDLGDGALPDVASPDAASPGGAPAW